jgi:hypothetical protein
MIGFSSEAKKAFDFLLKAGAQCAVPELAEAQFAEATGLVKYPFLAEQITMAEYDALISEVHEARQSRFRNLLVDTNKLALHARQEWPGDSE